MRVAGVNVPPPPSRLALLVLTEGLQTCVRCETFEILFTIFPPHSPDTQVLQFISAIVSSRHYIDFETHLRAF